MTDSRMCSGTGEAYLLYPLMGLIALMISAAPATAAVVDVTMTDVTTRAFSVVWVSNEPVTNATVRVFSDAAGTVNITSSLAVTLASALFPPALTQGIVKVSVTGLQADTSVFIQTETTSTGGTLLVPAVPPFLEVRTSARTTKANALNEPIANDLILHNVVALNGTTPVAGTLVMVRAPNLAAAPLTAFVGEGFPLSTAVVDLNNMFDALSEESAEVPGGTLLELTELRGLRCPGLVNHRLFRFRRAPAHEESPPITEIETAVPCFFADTVCDDEVNTRDAQQVLNIFDENAANCAFNSDLDIVTDSVINILDVQSVLNRFGERAPFAP